MDVWCLDFQPLCLQVGQPRLPKDALWSKGTCQPLNTRTGLMSEPACVMFNMVEDNYRNSVPVNKSLIDETPPSQLRGQSLKFSRFLFF